MTEPSTPARLRALVAALPEHQRQPWEYRATSVHMDGSSHGSVVAIPHAGPSPVPSVDGAVGELAATVASPPVVLAIADLLEAVQRQRSGAKAGWLDQDIDDAYDALEAAIERRQQ